jgi:PAS domain S-box-containing protein
MQSPPYILPLLITAVLSALLAFVLWRRRRAPGAVPLAILMGALVIWSLAYAVSLVATSLAVQLFWSNVAFLGIVLIPLTWLAFALLYTGQGAWVTVRRIGVLLIMPLTTLVMVWSNELHGLFRSEVYQVQVGSFVVLEATLGPFFWIHTAYSYLLLLTGTLLLVRNLLHMPSPARKQAGGLLIGLSAPWIGNFFYLSGLNPFPHLDLTPFALGVSGIALSWDLLRFGLFELVPIAQSTVFQSMEDSVIVLDEHSRIVDINPAALALLNRSAGDVYGQPIAHVFAEQAAIIERFQPVHEAHEELLVEGADEVRTFDLRISPITDRQARLKGRVIVLRDMTERKRDAAELRRRNEELAALAAENARLYNAVQVELAERTQAQEALILAKEAAEVANRAKSRFLGNMSHELRTPLTAILGYADLLEMELKAQGNPELESDIASIKAAGQHLLDLIGDVLDLTRIEADQLDLHQEYVAIADLLYPVVDTVMPLVVKNGNTLHLECPPESGELYGDSLRIRQVLLNILGNAAKFTEHGRITVRVVVGETAAQLGDVEAPLLGAAPLVAFEISDTGIGISPDQQLRLFQEFVQVDDSSTRKYGGSGLGLAISYRLCRLMGGAISVNSTPGRGSTFTIILPRHRRID